MRQVGGFLRVLRFTPTIKLTATIQIVLKVVLNTTKQSNNQMPVHAHLNWYIGNIG